MRWIKTFESQTQDFKDKFKDISKEIRKTRVPITSSEYLQKHFELDDEWGLEAGIEMPKHSQTDDFFHYDTGYNSFREVASDHYSLKVIKAVANKLEKPNINFCDFGCGLGQIVYYCKKMGMNSIGVEFQERLEAAHKSLGIDVLYGNFFDMDLSFLKTQDIIYAYRPIDDTAGITKLLSLLYNNTKEDIVIIFSMLDSRSQSNFEKIVIRKKRQLFQDCILLK
jgi:hypothetical protein